MPALMDNIASQVLFCHAPQSDLIKVYRITVQPKYNGPIIIIEKRFEFVSMAYRMMYEGIRMLADRTRQAFAGLRAVVRVIPL